MLSIPLLKVILTEIATKELAPRVNEPDLIMDDPDKVDAYTLASNEGCFMDAIYLFNTAQVSELIRPGDTVVDLACGPAGQLGMIAKLNPDAGFIGIDLSKPMLDRADVYLKKHRLTNVKTQQDSMTELAALDDQSVDVVFSTMALHHLPDQQSLADTFTAIKRVLKPGGGVYLIDFSRLKSSRSINYFAYQYADKQPELFTLDYLYSLRAAFSIADFKQAKSCLPESVQFYKSAILPLLVAFKTKSRQEKPLIEQRRTLLAMESVLSDHHKIDINDIKGLFQLGGLSTRLLK